MQMELGGGEAINLIGWANQVNEEIKWPDFSNESHPSTHIKEPRCHELHVGAAVSELAVSSV